MNNYVKLNNGVEMPKLGFGVFQIQDQNQCEEVVYEALKTGYRLIDTAAAYMNEEAVGRAIKRSEAPREEIFITTKLWIQDAGYESAKVAFNTSLEKLGLEYIDLYLIHQPIGDYYGAWHAMEDLYKEGKIRAIGISNFSNERTVDLILHNQVVPAVNQIEIHPFYQQQEALDVLSEYNVQAECWGPFAEGQKDIFTNEILKEIADKYDKTPAQVILRWHIQRNVVAIPKSIRLERMKENYDIWNFELSENDMKQIQDLDTKQGLFVDHGSHRTTIMLSSLKIHG